AAGRPLPRRWLWIVWQVPQLTASNGGPPSGGPPSAGGSRFPERIRDRFFQRHGASGSPFGGEPLFAQRCPSARQVTVVCVRAARRRPPIDTRRIGRRIQPHRPLSIASSGQAGQILQNPKGTAARPGLVI